MALAPFETCRAPNGMVCSVDHLASSAGVAMLRRGGTAADAAVAASAVLAVTTQHMCGMGGDLFALVSAGPGAPAALNSSGRAGSGADPDRLRAEGHSAMPFRGDIRSVPVPGCVDGWVALHERFGRLPLADVLEPARAYAESGFPVAPLLSLSVLLVADLPDAADYLDAGGGAAPAPGTIVRRPGVARTLAAIAKEGRAGFYRGEFGEGLLALGGGEYAEADLGRPLADWVEPISVEAWDRTLWTTPPNSQGYLTLSSAWIADGLDLPAEAADPLWAHYLIESARAAAWDRVDVLSEHTDTRGCLSPWRLTQLRNDISPDRALPLGPSEEYAGGGTIFLCAADAEGTGVSLIQSNASGWGSHLVEPRTRIFLQNRGIGFSLVEGHPAEYGPGRRPPHTLSPALVTSPDGSLDMVIGTMGGDGQPQTLLQLLARLLHGPSPEAPAEAIAAGRWTLTSASGAGGFDTWTERGRVAVQVEGHAPEQWDEGLRARGHAVSRVGGWSHGFGHAHVIRAAAAGSGGGWAGASDPRALTGAAVGY